MVLGLRGGEPGSVPSKTKGLGVLRCWHLWCWEQNVCGYGV